MLERYEIEAFLTLAEELHFGRTAERLHVTPARISQTIKRLERRVGATLFERTSRRVALTALGRQLRDDVGPAWQRVEAGFTRAVDAGRGVDGVLRTGFVGAGTGRLLGTAVALYRARHPAADVRIHEVRTGEVVRLLRADEVDVVIAALPAKEPDLTAGPVLLREPRVLAVPTRHPLADRVSLTIEDVPGDALLDAPCSLPGHRPDPARAATSPSAVTFTELLTLVGAGYGVVSVTEQAIRYYPRPDVAYVPLHDAPPLAWGPIWRTVNTNARIRAFAQAAADATR